MSSRRRSASWYSKQPATVFFESWANSNTRLLCNFCSKAAPDYNLTRGFQHDASNRWLTTDASKQQKQHQRDEAKRMAEGKRKYDSAVKIQVQVQVRVQRINEPRVCVSDLTD